MANNKSFNDLIDQLLKGEISSSEFRRLWDALNLNFILSESNLAQKFTKVLSDETIDLLESNEFIISSDATALREGRLEVLLAQDRLASEAVTGGVRARRTQEQKREDLTKSQEQISIDFGKKGVPTSEGDEFLKQVEKGLTDKFTAIAFEDNTGKQFPRSNLSVEDILTLGELRQQETAISDIEERVRSGELTTREEVAAAKAAPPTNPQDALLEGLNLGGDEPPTETGFKVTELDIGGKTVDIVDLGNGDFQIVPRITDLDIQERESALSLQRAQTQGLLNTQRINSEQAALDLETVLGKRGPDRVARDITKAREATALGLNTPSVTVDPRDISPEVLAIFGLDSRVPVSGTREAVVAPAAAEGIGQATGMDFTVRATPSGSRRDTIPFLSEFNAFNDTQREELSFLANQLGVDLSTLQRQSRRISPAFGQRGVGRIQ